jgi:uncharacterized membrane protein
MTLKEYQRIRLVFVFVTAMIFSQTLFYKNYFIPIAFLLVASLIHLYLRRQVKEVLADERDYALGGKSALLAIQIYSWFAVMAMFVFYALRDVNPSYEPIGMTLAYSTMVLMLTYAVIFRYFSNYSFSDKRLLFAFLMLVAFAAMFVVGLRGLSGEDGWICSNGRWVEHGHPSFPAPSAECK